MTIFTQAHAYDLAQRYVGTKEMSGSMDNPAIMAMLTLDNDWPEEDEVPWCSAFVNFIAWSCRHPRSKSLRARSWLRIGKNVPLNEAKAGDIVILQRGKGDQPGPEVIEAPGHVGFFAGYIPGPVGGELGLLEVLGGNQSDSVKISRYPVERLLGVRRLT